MVSHTAIVSLYRALFTSIASYVENLEKHMRTKICYLPFAQMSMSVQKKNMNVLTTAVTLKDHTPVPVLMGTHWLQTVTTV